MIEVGIVASGTARGEITGRKSLADRPPNIACVLAKIGTTLNRSAKNILCS
jgi:hypothetical protein